MREIVGYIAKINTNEISTEEITSLYQSFVAELISLKR